jgi:hypothetical protein
VLLSPSRTNGKLEPCSCCLVGRQIQWCYGRSNGDERMHTYTPDHQIHSRIRMKPGDQVYR